MPCLRDPVQRLGLDYDNLRGDTLEMKMLYLIELARAAFGMWAGREDIDEDWLQRGRERWRSE